MKGSRARRAPRTSRRSPTSTDDGPRAPDGARRPTSSPPTTAPASSTSRPRSARTTSGCGEQLRASTVPHPVEARRHVRRAHRAAFAGRCVKDADPDIVETSSARGLLFRDRARTSTPTRTAGAADNAAHLLRAASWYIRTTALQGRAARQRTSRSTGCPSTSRTAASATCSRTTSTGRSRASATGARRCRLGAASEDVRRALCVGSLGRSCATLGRRRHPTTSTAPTSTR